MNIEMIDLEEFFDDKNKDIDGMGIGATGIITQSQMVTRYNNYSNFNKGKIKGTGSHFNTEGMIMSEIFDFNANLFLGYGFDPNILNTLDKNHRKVLGEVAVIKYLNSSAGKYALIYLPIEQETITEKQLEALRYAGEEIANAGRKLRKPIKIVVTDRRNKATEINSIDYNIIPFLEKHINNDYEQSVPDKNIIAVEEIEIKNLGHRTI